ncbi:MAG: hypothetical protein R2854_31055 [Caldilineaceae bacterium]
MTIGNRVVCAGRSGRRAGASITNGAILDGPVVVDRTRVRDYCQIGGHVAWWRGVCGHGAEFSPAWRWTRSTAITTAKSTGAWWARPPTSTRLQNARQPALRRRRHGLAPQGPAERPRHAANAAYFGDFMRTGVNAVIMPGRRMGAYSVVGPGVILYDDLPDRRIVTAQQELRYGDWGPARYGW